MHPVTCIYRVMSIFPVMSVYSVTSFYPMTSINPVTSFYPITSFYPMNGIVFRRATFDWLWQSPNSAIRPCKVHRAGRTSGEMEGFCCPVPSRPRLGVLTPRTSIRGLALHYAATAASA